MSEIKTKPYKATIEDRSVLLPPEVEEGEVYIFTEEHTINDILRFAYEQLGDSPSRDELKAHIDIMELP